MTLPDIFNNKINSIRVKLPQESRKFDQLLNRNYVTVVGVLYKFTCLLNGNFKKKNRKQQQESKLKLENFNNTPVNGSIGNR